MKQPTKIINAGLTKILKEAQSETIRTLAHNSVSSIAYDAIGDMAIKAIKLIYGVPEGENIPEDFMNRETIIDENKWQQVQEQVPFDDLIRDLWSLDRIEEIRGKMTIISEVHTVLNNTWRGHVVQDVMNHDFVLCISVLAKR